MCLTKQLFFLYSLLVRCALLYDALNVFCFWCQFLLEFVPLGDKRPYVASHLRKTKSCIALAFDGP